MFAFLKKLEFKIWDLNLVLTIVGFPVFTMLIGTDWSGIAFRGLALFVALLSLLKTGIHLPESKLTKLFLFLLLYESVQMWIDFYFGEYANTPFVYSRMQAMLFNIGVVWMPVLAVCSSLKIMNWRAIMWMAFVLLGFSVLKGDLSSIGAELTVDGRVNMSDKISPISYGDYSAFMVFLSTSLLLKYRNNDIKLFSPIPLLLIIGIFAGVYGVAKAGSRGPLVGLTFGFLFLFLSFPSKWKNISVLTLIIAIFTGALSMGLIEEFAPALVARFTQTLEDGDTGNRDVLFDLAMKKWEGHHLLGTNCIYLEYTEFSSYHNMYVDAFLATGIIGGLLYCYSIIKLALKAYFYKYKTFFVPSGYFFVALFLFHVGRGLSGIMIIANAQIVVSFIIAVYFLSMRKKVNF